MMRYVMMIVPIVLMCTTTGCSDKKAQQEQAQIDAAMAQHCQRIRQLTLDQYVQQYILHNGDTPKDRRSAEQDYQQCLGASRS